MMYLEHDFDMKQVEGSKKEEGSGNHVASVTTTPKV